MRSELSILADVPLFSGLTRPELKRVLHQAREVRFNQGDTLIRAGDPGGRCFIVTQGRVRVSVPGKRAKLLGPGAFLGEMSLIDRGPRSATVVAESPVRALAIGSVNFLALLEENWAMARKIMLVLVRRVRELEKPVTGLS